MQIGTALHGCFADLLDSPREHWPVAFSDRVHEDRDDDGMVLARVMAETPEGRMSVFAFVQWAAVGFPMITVGHRFAASLLVTTATEDVVTLARAPFPAFLIQLPVGPLEIDDPYQHGRLPLHRVLVSTMPDPRGKDPFAWSFAAYAEKGVCVWRSGVRSVEMQPERHEDFEGLRTDIFNMTATSRDERALSLLGRLIIHTCLAMSDPSQVRPIGRSHQVWSHWEADRAKRSPEPAVRVFQLGRPVRHDFREAVREYLGGERRKLSVQCFVAGHYKMQPHGPRNSLRKLIWREPFWRGPEDAPIVVRPHVLDPRGEREGDNVSSKEEHRAR